MGEGSILGRLARLFGKGDTAAPRPPQSQPHGEQPPRAVSPPDPSTPPGEEPFGTGYT